MKKLYTDFLGGEFVVEIVEEVHGRSLKHAFVRFEDGVEKWIFSDRLTDLPKEKHNETP